MDWSPVADILNVLPMSASVRTPDSTGILKVWSCLTGLYIAVSLSFFSVVFVGHVTIAETLTHSITSLGHAFDRYPPTKRKKVHGNSSWLLSTIFSHVLEVYAFSKWLLPAPCIKLIYDGINPPRCIHSTDYVVFFQIFGIGFCFFLLLYLAGVSGMLLCWSFLTLFSMSLNRALTLLSSQNTLFTNSRTSFM